MWNELKVLITKMNIKSDRINQRNINTTNNQVWWSRSLFTHHNSAEVQMKYYLPSDRAGATSLDDLDHKPQPIMQDEDVGDEMVPGK